jgi:hypothetical protein
LIEALRKMIEVKISGLKVADYWSPADGWNYDAIDSLAKELYDRYREAEAEQTVELFKNHIERMSILHEIDPFYIDYIRNQIEWMIRPLMHRGMTMKKWLQINALIYEIVEKSLPSYLDNMAMLHQLQKELEDVALHRYLITPFGKRMAVWK